jgi:hypothetical protein
MPIQEVTAPWLAEKQRERREKFRRMERGECVDMEESLGRRGVEGDDGEEEAGRDARGDWGASRGTPSFEAVEEAAEAREAVLAASVFSLRR